MPRFLIFQLLEEKSQRFREKTPAEGPYRLRAKDYEAGGEIEADTAYDAWKRLQSEQETATGRKFGVGDALQLDSQLFLCNFWGFDEGGWEAEQGQLDVMPVETSAGA